MFGLEYLDSYTCNQLPGSLRPDYKYLHASQIPHRLSFASHTRLYKHILLVSFAITLNHRRTFLLHINTPMSKLKYSPCSGICTSHTLYRIAEA